MISRAIRIEGLVAYVPLTKGYEAIIDAVDVPLVERLTWRALVRKDTVYAQAQGPRPERRSYLLHRVIAGEPTGKTVDHRDGNGLDNRRNNLRAATHAENARNCRRARNNTSGFKGVAWDRRAKRWQANINVNGKMKNLGRFETPEAAHEAYKEASNRLHGEFGRVK